MLFIIALEPLQKMLALAEQESVLQPIHSRAAKIRVSLYADDAAVFANPIKEDINLIKEVFEVFGEASGLKINLAKSAVYPIRCDGIDLQEVLADFRCNVLSFPCKYLGLPLSVRCLRRVDVQPFIDKVASKLPAGKRKIYQQVRKVETCECSPYLHTSLLPNSIFAEEVGFQKNR